MAARVLRGLAAELIGGAARSAELKEHRSQQREELLMNGKLSRACRDVSRTTRMVRADGEDGFIIDFCSFVRGRLPDRTP